VPLAAILVANAVPEDIGVYSPKQLRSGGLRGALMIVINTSAQAYSAALLKNLPCDPLKDFIPVTPLTSQPYVLVAGKLAGITTVGELVAAAKAKPGQLKFGSMGRHDEAIEEIRKAQKLDPLALIVSVAEGRILHFPRRFDEAIGQFQKTLELDPNFIPAHCDLGASTCDFLPVLSLICKSLNRT
jgi:tetratricopeptide (TPR) repeat protein